MLVISRKRHESATCKVGDIEIKVTVVELRGDKVRLGFEAPREAVIHRDEVWRAIAREELEASE